MSYYVGKINNNEFLILKDQNKIKFSWYDTYKLYINRNKNKQKFILQLNKMKIKMNNFIVELDKIIDKKNYDIFFEIHNIEIPYDIFIKILWNLYSSKQVYTNDNKLIINIIYKFKFNIFKDIIIDKQYINNLFLSYKNNTSINYILYENQIKKKYYFLFNKIWLYVNKNICYYNINLYPVKYNNRNVDYYITYINKTSIIFILDSILSNIVDNYINMSTNINSITLYNFVVNKPGYKQINLI